MRARFPRCFHNNRRKAVRASFVVFKRSILPFELYAAWLGSCLMNVNLAIFLSLADLFSIIREKSTVVITILI